MSKPDWLLGRWIDQDGIVTEFLVGGDLRLSLPGPVASSPPSLVTSGKWRFLPSGQLEVIVSVDSESKTQRGSVRFLDRDNAVIQDDQSRSSIKRLPAP
jgi:hypothetical protein